MTLALAAVVSQLIKGPPPISQQLGEVIREAARHGFRTQYNRELDLRGTGQTAHLLILRPTIARGYASRSDELRIYDEDPSGKHIRLALRIQPRSGPRDVQMRFNFVRVGRFGSSDQKQAILTLDPSYADGAVVRPIALVWKAIDDRYVLRSLLTEPIDLPRTPAGEVRPISKIYRPIDVRMVGGKVLRALGSTQDFRVERERMASAYVVSQGCNGCPGNWEFKAWSLDFDEPGNSGLECHFYAPSGRRQRLILRVRRPADAAQGLATALRRSCGY